MTTGVLRIELLASRMDLLPVVARWIFDTWWQEVEGESAQTLADRLRGHRVPGQLPQTLVALQDEEAVGTATLIAHDVGTDRWNHLSPWLAAVYVEPAWRRHGIGSRLVNEAVLHVQALGRAPLYLMTTEREDFYARLGWRVLERAEEGLIMAHGETAGP